MSKLNVLIVDDHPMISDAYEKALIKIDKSSVYNFEIDIANTIDDALDRIKRKDGQSYQLYLLDVKLPASSNGEFFSGEDLGVYIKELYPEAKILISTTFNDNYRINNILRSINPHGFLIKDDTTPQDFINAIKTILDDLPYYSPKVTKLLRKHITNDFYLDKIDRELLYHLSLGTKTVDLPNLVPLSIGGIERRKRHIKELFNIPGEDDKTLIQLAKEKGFI